MDDKLFWSKLKNTATDTDYFIKHETGELMGSDQEKKWRVEVTPDNFIFIYGRLISALENIPEVEIKVFLCICEKVDFGTCNLRMTKSIYESVAKKLGFVEGTVRNAISLLSGKGFLIKHPTIRGHYRVNPEYAWKGKQSGRTDALKTLLIEVKEAPFKFKEKQSKKEEK